MVWARVPRLAKESVAPERRSSADWVPERIGRWPIGVGQRHPVTMRKTSFKTVDETSVCTATPNWCAVRRVLAPEPASRLTSVTQVASFLLNASRWWRNVSDLSGFNPR